jgi:hypothetical protein
VIRNCTLTVMGIALIAGCSGKDDDNWLGGLSMHVHWHHYKDATGPCHRMLARATNRDPDSFTSKPTHACREIKDTDCNVYSDESAKATDFGELVQDCFDTRNSEIH